MGKITRKYFQKLLLLIFLSFSISGLAQQMDLRGNSEYTEGQCPANDVQIVSAEVDLGSVCNDCSPGDLITADILITIQHNTNSSNRYLAVMGDLTETFSGGGSAMSTFAECSGPLDKSNDPSGGLATYNFGQITFTCGSELVLDNILLVWTAAMGSCPVTPANNPNGKYCYDNPTINITPPLNAMASASCSTGNNVDVDLTVQGGVMPFTFLWNNGATTEDLTAVAPGTYSVVATGADGCTATTSITVGPALVATGTPSDVLCFGDATGAIDLSVLGGVAPLTFSWDSGQITEDISGLLAGDYSVTITDSLGCVITENFTIAEPTELTCSVVQDNPASSGNSDGEATVTPAGGTPGYSYLWDNGNTNATANDLDGGIHSVEVTDANGCTTTCQVTIEELDPLECSIALEQDEQCFGDADGSATANPVGGVAPYSYLWDNGETVQTAIGLAQGVHSVTVTDANGAETTCEITIGGPAAALAADAVATDVLCFGELTGSVDLTVTGGTPTYTYLWDNGATTEDLADVAAGTYNVTITDANGCETTASATVGQPTAALAADAVATDVLCFGELTGSVDLTVTGGTTAYTYLWDNGATTEDLADVAAGTYNVTITDANGCETTASATVGQPTAALTCSIALDSGVSVNGASDGSATVTALGGTSAYTYLWDNGETTEQATALDAGLHTVTVTDANGCETMCEVTVTQPDVLSCSVALVNNVLCFGDSTGSATANPVGGVAPYSYLWDNGETVQTAIGLAQGAHSVTVTDANGAETTCEITIGGPAAALAADAVATDVLCFGELTGSVDLTVTGGTPTYTYLWDNGATTEDLADVAAGTYNVTITDANGCETTASATVGQPTAALAADAVATDVLCFGELTGSVDLTVTGGTTAYTYLWDNGATTEDLADVAAGTYNVTITDANGCETTASATVGQPTAALAADAVATDVLCFGELTGSVDLTVTGGTTAYTYLWDNGATTEDLADVAAGTYNVTITDANGCETTASATVGQPTAALTCSIALDSGVSVNGASDGSATVTALGGTSAYTYLWDNGETTEQATALDAGLHTVTVTDANGCETMCEVTVTQPDVLSCSVTLEQDEQCFGDADGSATANPVGGVAPYSYLWDNGETVQTAIGLAQGAHSVTVTDANGAETTCEITIGGPAAALAADAVATDVLCFGELTGSVDLTVTGGTPTYTYLWDNGATTEDLADVAAGTYNVTITDANGCETTASATVGQPTAALTCSIALDSGVSVNGASDGSATVTALGGTSAYTYLWDNGETTEQATALDAGLHTVTVTDANGCETMCEVTVTQPDVLSCSVALVNNVLCFGDSTGSATANPVGGVAPYSYLWDNGETVQTAIALNAGLHTVTVTDANGAETMCEITITEPEPADAGADENITVCDGNIVDLTLLVTVDGGTFSEAIVTGGLNGTNFDTTGLSPGTYEVIYTVEAGDTCPVDTATITITVDELIDAGGDKELAACESTVIDLSTLVDVAGGTFTPQGGGLSGSTLDTSGFAPGEYMYTYTIDGNGTCPGDTATITIMISEDIIDKECKVIDADFCDSSTDPFYNFYWFAMEGVSGSPFFSQDATHTLNFTQFNNGTALITGMTQQNGCSAELYIFLEDKKDWTQWTADGGTYKPQGCAGTIKEQMQYYVIDGSRSWVKTTGACVEEGTYIITQRPDPNDFSTPNLGVHVGPGGALWDSNQGAEGLAGWAWMGPQGDEQRWKIDFNFLLDCEEKVGCIIDDPDRLDCEIANVEDVTCNGGNDGSATVMVTGGLLPYSYAWSNGETNMTAINLTEGTHTVTVTDSENTVTECSVTIGQPELLECTVALVNGVSAIGVNDGSATVAPTGGTPSFTYLWDNNETTQTATALSAGTHMVTVTDANGCETNCSVDVPQPGMLACEATGADVSCYDGTDGTATVTPIGGLAPYSYSWSNGDTTQSITGLAAGTYEVTVSDANGRDTKCEVEITQPAEDLTCMALVFGNVSTHGGSDGKAIVTPEGGTLPYTYLWDNGETAAMAEALDAGQHTVTVTDANGCMTECSVEIMQPVPDTFECEATGTDVSCYDGTDGTATVTPMGGLAPYSYSWSNGDTTQSITGLAAGTYEVTVSDANGRDTKCEVEITQPTEALSCTAMVSSNVSTNGGSDGVATVTPEGGTLPYTYLWDNGETAAMAEVLDAGQHTVTVTDANGCMTECSVEIMQPVPDTFECEATGTDVSCYDGTDGTATVTPMGGLAPYSYSWSNGDTTQSITGLAAGTYEVTVSDANGRDTKCEVEITQPTEALSCTAMVSSNVSTNGGSDGVATVTPEGGTLPYTYLWDNGETAAMAEALDAGQHTVTVTDANGCMTECSVEIMQPVPDTFECEATGTDVSCYDGTDGTATVTPMGGLAPYSYSWSNGDTTQSITGLAAGTYEVTVSDANGRDTSCELEITQPAEALSCTAMVSSNVSTNGGSDGVATVTAEGGTLPYTYLWDNGETAVMAEALDAGVHTVTVTDANGCITECSVEIEQPTPNGLACEATGTDVSCYDGTDGTATVTPMGGLAPYSYSWSNGDTTQSITGLAAGTYEVTVSDANGRDTKCEVEITQPMEAISCSITDVVNSNEGQNNGEATASPSGGTAPYTYLWNDSQAQTTATATGLAPDSYTVTTTDANGCETSCMITIEEIPDGGPVTGCETAFARDAQTNTCFLDDGFGRWGWTNYYENEGDYMLDLYSGAGQCNLTSGEKSGNVQVAYSGGTVTVTIEMLDGFVMQEAQLYVGSVKYPSGNNGRPTVAPGQYTQVKPGLNDLVTYEFDPITISGGIYVIVHVNACKKSNNAGRVSKTAVTAYPMTFKNDLNLKVDIPYDAQLKVEMFDVNGRCIVSKNGMNVKSGSNNVHLNVSGLAPDMYILVIDTGKEKIMKKVLSKK